MQDASFQSTNPAAMSWGRNPAIDQADAHVRVRFETGLTRREIDVLRVIADGHPNKICAQRLYLSTHTVNRHLRSIFRKLGVANRTQAAVSAVRLGLLEETV